MNQLTNSCKASSGAKLTRNPKPQPATNQIEVKDKVQQSGLNTNLKRVLRTKSSLLGI
jgi:hypothetical protein